MPTSPSPWNGNRRSPPPIKSPRDRHANSPPHVDGGKRTIERAISGSHVADVNLTFTIDGAPRAVACVNDRIVWTADTDGGLRVRSFPKGTVLKDVAGRVGSSCSALLYVALQHQMWAAFEDGTARIYDIPTCALVNEFMVNPKSRLGKENKIHVLVELEGCVFMGCEDGCIVQRNALDSRLERLLRGHRGGVQALAVYVGPTGSVVFSGCSDGSVKGWDPYKNEDGVDRDATADAACIHTFRKGGARPSSPALSGAIRALEVVPHTNRIWSGGDDHTVRVWNLETLRCEAVLQDAHAAPVTCLLALASRMWTGDAQGCLLLWDMASLTVLQDLSSREQLDTGGLWFIKKMQPSMSWKVWTAGKKGGVQCWNAEASPILFHGSHVTQAGQARSTGEYGGSRSPSKAETWALLAQDDTDNMPCESVDIAQLGFNLACERGRLRLQHELQVHQLFEEENAFLKKRVQELEAERAASLSSQEAQRRQPSKSTLRSSEGDIVSILRHEREIIEKELELLRDENYALLRLLEQHTERREEGKYTQKGASQVVMEHRVRSELRQGDAPRGSPALSTSVSSSPSARRHGSSENVSTLRSAGRSVRQAARDPEDHGSRFAKEKKDPLHQSSQTEFRDEDLQAHVDDDLSMLKDQCDGYQAQIRRLIQEKEELQRALTDAEQKKMHNVKQNDEAQHMRNVVSSAQKDNSTTLVPTEVASLREELGKVRLICANKTAALFKLQKEIGVLKRAGGTPRGRDVASQSTTPSLDSHADASHGEPKSTPSPAPKIGHAARSFATTTTTATVSEENKFLQTSQDKHRAPAPPVEANLSPEAQNLALSVRLTDAESVITELEALLNRCVNQLAEEREARHRLEQRISGLEATST
ncbi:unnamed protein product [Phytomonas sp. EM1]|nr:unnamed protein product [Phytomonas sp. EM1]|eukprot:CCW62956.1 unnamed protein product [Phytomonas sp. isolate EM1]